MSNSGVHDRVKETTTTTGTSAITLLGATSQFQGFAAKFALRELVYYTIVGQAGTEWEVGRGYLRTSTVFVRDVVFESSNANALVNFSAGTKDIFSTIPAAVVDSFFTIGQIYAAGNGSTLY